MLIRPFVFSVPVPRCFLAQADKKTRNRQTEDRGTSKHEWLENSNFLIKQLLTPEDGQFRLKHVVILKILKSDKC
jgi:hypothetical protein